MISDVYRRSITNKLNKMMTIAFCVGALSVSEGYLQGQTMPENAHEDVSTFSIVARDSLTGELGVAVASRFFAVGAVVPWARADVGAVATQSLTK